MDMHRLGHPSYANLVEDVVKGRAGALPENGVPPEVLKVLLEAESSHDKLQPQKAATPCDGMEPPQEAGQTFATQRARAVVAEGQSRQDENQLGLAALKDMRDQVLTEAEKEAAGIQNLEVRTGNQFLDQFQPYYFSVAFPFCFKFGTACPDVFNTTKQQDEEAGNPRPRRIAGNPKAPEVSIQEWAAAMARRVETQFRRDWTFAFTLWNFLFRTMVNLQKNTYMYAVPDRSCPGGKRWLTNKEIADGGVELYHKLCHGTYISPAGELRPVGQDFAKLRQVPNLSEPAQKVLDNVEARTRNIPGTHENRKTMRHQTHANRICYGTALFITFSPSERDTTLMVRMARARQSDPAVQHDGTAKYQGRSEPRLDADYDSYDDCVRLSPEALAEARAITPC